MLDIDPERAALSDSALRFDKLTVLSNVEGKGGVWRRSRGIKKGGIMFKIFKFALCFCACLFVTCGGGSSGTFVMVSFSPANDAANVAVNATITATFSGAVTAPSDWTSHFTLKKNNSGSNLCTGYSTSADGLTITCTHDNLETATSYTLRVSGIDDANGKAVDSGDSSFTTVGYTPVGGTVTLTGTLSAVSTNVSSKGVLSKAAVDVTSYKVLILNNGTAEQTIATVAADGSFSLTAIGGTSYMINFLNSNNGYVGTLETGTVTSNKVSVGVVTGGDDTTTDFGTVSANVSTGEVTSSETLTTDGNQLAYASGGVIAGGVTGEGSTDYTTAVGATACTSGAITCPDLDHDGVPDILDTDNDNNTLIDEVDGKVDLCVPASISLHIRNYTTAASAEQPGFPTPAEVDVNLAANSMYQIHLEMTPNAGYSISDFSEIPVTTPSYIDSYGYVYQVALGHDCFNKLWTNCNGKKMMLSNDGTRYEIALADIDLLQAGVLSNMKVGDTFVFNIAMKDGTQHTCTRKINAIPKYFPYELKKDGTLVTTSSNIQTNWLDPFTISWTVPTQLPKGLTYVMRVVPFGASCSWNPDNYTEFSAGADGSSKALDIASLPTSAVQKWGFYLDFNDEAGDDSSTGWINFTSAATDPCL